MSRHVLALLTCTLVCTSALPAQRPLALGVAGGASFPTGDLSDGAKAGWHAAALLALSSPMQPLGLRVEGAYHRFGLGEDVAASPGSDAARTVTTATANVTYRLPMTNSPLSPYVITGLGAHHLACTGEAGCDGTTRFGWNAGVGTKLYVRGVSAFLEARYHRTSLDGGGVSWVPLTLGLMF